MIHLLNWFQINYPHLKQALLESNHNFNNRETNPYHVEGDCWSHTMMVCKVAELRGYDRVVQVSALLHDIGKPQSRKINPKNNHVNFWGHEELSAKMAEPLVADLVAREMLSRKEGDEVLELIALHSYLYTHSQDEIYNRFRDNLGFFRHLVELGICDNLGRFSEQMEEANRGIEAILDKMFDNKI